MKADSNTDNSSNGNKPDLVKYIGLGFMAGLIVAVLALEYYGYIKHPTEQDALVVEEYRLLTLKTEQDLKISPKSSGREAFCVNGYLLVRPQNGHNVAGILVDKKNRGIHCEVNMLPSRDTDTE
ncbi:MAG: hypothetical protein KYX62_05545 [Pseudomonadota bacterium]|nr:hypothetical protein [Pseudomonadota bacterium]